MRQFYLIAFVVMVACLGCQWKLKPVKESAEVQNIKIERYDQIESLYLKTGDVAALQQLHTDYSVQTRMLIEDVLRLGRIDEPDIDAKFYQFYQDSTLQVMLAEVDKAYADITGINKELNQALGRLHKLLPELKYPRIYTQITALDQSIVVGNGLVGISLDKYLGANHPLYLRFGYSEGQRRMMTREFIVPDCLSFYLLSQYERKDMRAQMPKIQYVVNRVLERKVFDNAELARVEKYMKEHQSVTVSALLNDSTPIL